MNRRTVLALFSGTPLITAGCLERLDNPDTPVQLCQVGIQNHTTASYQGEIQVLQDETVLVEYSGDVNPAEGGNVDGVETTILGGVSMSAEDIPDDAGQYQVQMRITGDNVDIGDTFDTVDATADHVTVLGLIQKRGGDGDERVVFATAPVPQQNECS